MADERGDRDAFEAMDMHDGSPVLHRDKLVSRGMAGVMLLPALLTAALSMWIPFQNATASRPVPDGVLPFVAGGLALMSLLFVFLAIAFGVLRTVLTKRALHVKYGLWGPTLDVASIREARVVPYAFVKYGGWGIRHGIDGSWAYVAPGRREVVEIVYEDEKGKEKKVVVGPQDPAALVAAITRARGGARVRVAPPPAGERDLDAEFEAEAEEEARADAEAERREG